MSIQKPFHRIYRPVVNTRRNHRYSSVAYLSDKDYADTPEMYTRAFTMIQKELQDLFYYVEPADLNLKTYSLRIQALFVRVCIEVEANFKAILSENKYESTAPSNWTIKDYRKINKTHHLSSYKVTFPIWSGCKAEFSPFDQWSNNLGDLSWYRIYNKCKHNRYGTMAKANFESLLNAFSALFVLLSAQFWTESYEPGSCLLAVSNPDGYYPDKFGIGDYMLIDFPDDWKEEELYDFDWNELSVEQDKFMKFNYDAIN